MTDNDDDDGGCLTESMLEMLAGFQTETDSQFDEAKAILPKIQEHCAESTEAFVSASLDVRMSLHGLHIYVPFENEFAAFTFVSVAETKNNKDPSKKLLVDSLFVVMPTEPPNQFRPYSAQKEDLMRNIYDKHVHSELNANAKASSDFLYTWALQCHQFLRDNENRIKQWAHDTNPWKLFGHENPKPAPIMEVLITIVRNYRLEGSVEHTQASANWKWCRNALCISFVCCGWGDIASLLLATRIQTSCKAMMHSSAHASIVLEDMTLLPSLGSCAEELLDLFDLASCQSPHLPLPHVKDVCDLNMSNSVDDLHGIMCGMRHGDDTASAREALIPVMCKILPDMMKVGADLLLLHGLLLNHMQPTRKAAADFFGMQPPRPPSTLIDLQRERFIISTLACHQLLDCLSELGSTHRRLCDAYQSYTQEYDILPVHSRVCAFLTMACDGVSKCAQSAERILAHHNNVAHQTPQTGKVQTATHNAQGVRRRTPKRRRV